jgi:hypothetical protein
MDWLKKFVLNRALYMVLLAVLCAGIFPFVILYCLTGWIGKSWKKFSPTSKLAARIEVIWDMIGVPYDALVKLVG